MFRLKKWSEVPIFLADYVGRESGDGKDRMDRILRAAQLLEDFGDRLTEPKQQEQAQIYFEKAGAWYEACAQKRPAGQMLLAGFQARHGKLSAAIELINRFGAKASPLDLRNAAVAVIHRETVKPQQLQEVEKVLAAAAAAHPHSVPLLNALIALKIGQEDFAAAEDLCRQLIAVDPKDYLACNNLGMLLALSGNKPDEALALVNSAIDLAGPLPMLLDSRAVVHIARNEPQPALEDLEAIAADKPDPVWLFHKARALVLEGQSDGAVAALAQARNKGLNRTMIDPPERPLFDQLQRQLAKHEEEKEEP